MQLKIIPLSPVQQRLSIPVNLPLDLSVIMCTLMRCEHSSNTPWGQFLIFTVCVCVVCMYVMYLYIYFTVNTSTHTHVKVFHEFVQKKFCVHPCDCKYLDIIYIYTQYMIYSTVKLEKLTKYKHLHTLTTMYNQTNQTYGLCIHLNIVPIKPRCWAPIASTLLPNAWTCTAPLPGKTDE